VADAQDPGPAPNGALVFVRPGPAGQELVRRGADGSEEVLVAARGFASLAAPRVSPDGQTVAFSAVGDGPLAGRPARAPFLRFGAPVAHAHGDPWDIWRVALAGGGLERVYKLAEDEPTAAWDPTGRFLAVLGVTGLYVLPVHGGGPIRLEYVGGIGGVDWTS
jgi:hypothetical protein